MIYRCIDDIAPALEHSPCSESNNFGKSAPDSLSNIALMHKLSLMKVISGEGPPTSSPYRPDLYSSVDFAFIR